VLGETEHTASTSCQCNTTYRPHNIFSCFVLKFVKKKKMKKEEISMRLDDREVGTMN
jgi:hypothetical protein